MPRQTVPSGKVRVAAHTLRNDSQEVSWRWEIWTSHGYSGMRSTSLGDVELTSSNPKAAGKHYTLEISAVMGTTPGGKPQLTHRMNVTCEDGGSAQGRGEELMAKMVPADRLARVLFTGDKLVSLPVKLPLMERVLEVEGAKPQRYTVFLIIPK